MLSKILRVLLVPKRARTRLAAPKPSAEANGAARGKLLDDAMAVYRRQRQDVYESLDETTRRQIEADAEKAFGQAARGKD